MFEKVLFSTDFSDYAKAALRCLAGFPGAREVILFHGIEQIRSPRGGGAVSETFYRPGDLLRKEEQSLEHLNRNLRVTTAMKTSSDIAGAIIEAAEENGVSLIILGARGKSRVEGIPLGSVPMAVLRRARTSVLIMRHRMVEGREGETYAMFCPIILSRILCPMDFSPHSDRAAALLGATEGVGAVILLHVVSRGETEGEIRDSVRAAEDRMESIRGSLAGKGIRVSTLVRTGDPALQIARAADEEDVSVIWMSPQGKGWFSKLLLGSTAFTVAKHATRPVMIIRTQENGELSGQNP